MQDQSQSQEMALIARARDVAMRAYVPYSHFRVGAALIDAQGTVYAGCNVESASYGLTVCAERNAMFAAIAAGAVRPFAALALTCLDAESGCIPCGACRQVIHEHFAPQATIFIDGAAHYTPGQLLPNAFAHETLVP